VRIRLEGKERPRQRATGPNNVRVGTVDARSISQKSPRSHRIRCTILRNHEYKRQALIRERITTRLGRTSRPCLWGKSPTADAGAGDAGCSASEQLGEASSRHERRAQPIGNISRMITSRRRGGPPNQLRYLQPRLPTRRDQARPAKAMRADAPPTS
jgi:hypothetical protein